jgi:hypothetical protein
LLSNGSVNKPQQRDRFYVVRDATVATQHRGKHISVAVGRHATMRNVWEVFCAAGAEVIQRDTGGMPDSSREFSVVTAAEELTCDYKTDLCVTVEV